MQLTLLIEISLRTIDTVQGLLYFLHAAVAVHTNLYLCNWRFLQFVKFKSNSIKNIIERRSTK